MKKINTLIFTFCLMLLVFPGRAASPLVITEIMYNDPSGGFAGDSLEYIEIYNASLNPVDLTGFTLSSGLTFTFPDTTLNGESYLVIARNAAAVQNFFSITGVLQWDAGQSLSNQGEAIVLSDNLGSMVDSVRYYTSWPWPLLANGYGSSAVLCDPSANNLLGASWTPATFKNANTYAILNNYTVYGSPGSGCNLSNIYVPVFATIPHLEDFEDTWIDGDYIRDVPSNHWKNGSPGGNNSWRRDDDGISALWTNAAAGAFTPAGAMGSSHAARFHSTSVQNNAKGYLDLYADFSPVGNKKLGFWYNNTAGTDSLAIWISTDNGSAFTYLQKFTNTYGWEYKQIYLGNITSTQVIIRFFATSNNTANDIGLDDVSISLAVQNDIGVSAVTEPEAYTFTQSDTTKVIIQNYGINDITSAQVNWSVNGIVQPPYTWSGTLGPGATSAEIQIGLASLQPLIMNDIKAWTSLPNGQTDGDALNDSSAAKVIYQGYVAIPYTEHFDDPWINKFNQRDVPVFHWVNTPATGNTSWRREDDGASAGWGNAGTGGFAVPGAANTPHSARFHTAGAQQNTQGNFDFYVDLSAPGDKELRYYYNNIGGTDTMNVFLSQDAGTSYALIQANTTTPSGGWEFRHVNLGNVTASQAIIKFRATSNGGQSDIGIDEVAVDFIKPDLALDQIIAPQSSCGLTSTEQVKIRVKNIGFMVIANPPVSFKLGSTVVNENIPVVIQPGDSADYTFTATVNLSAFGLQTLIVYSSVANDPNLTNDTLILNLINYQPVTTFPTYEKFEGSYSKYFRLANSTNARANWEEGIGRNGTRGLRMTGLNAGSWPQNTGSTTTATEAWETYTDHHAFAYTCVVDATALSSPELRLDLRQTHTEANGGPLYSWFRVLINDTNQVVNTYGIKNFNPFDPFMDPYTTHTFDLSAFANTQFTVTLQSSCRLNDAVAQNIGDNVFVDNVIIRNKPDYDIAVEEWVAPADRCGLTGNTAVVVKVTNYGTSDATNIPIKYSIDGGSTYQTNTIPGPISPGNYINYAFTTTADFSTPDIYECVVIAMFSTDQDHFNDTLYKKVYSLPTYNIANYYTEDFEGEVKDWFSGFLAGMDEWVLGAPAKSQIPAAHSGSQCWVTRITGNYHLNAESYVQSPCYDFTIFTDPWLSVWLNLRTEAGWDAMILEVNVLDTGWFKVDGDPGFYNNNSNNGNYPPPKWSGNNGGWTKYQTSLTPYAGAAKVQFRFRFESDYYITGQGIGIDDFTLFTPAPDVQMASILVPEASCDLTGTTDVTVQISNIGQLNATGITLKYKVDNGPFVTETITDTLNPGGPGMFSYTFTTPANLSLAGQHTLFAQVTAPGDFNTSNDTLSKIVYSTKSITSFPVTVNFDNPGYFDHFAPISADESDAYLQTTNAVSGAALMMTGGDQGTWPANTANTTTAAQAWSYLDHIATFSSCDVSGQCIELTFKLKQFYSEGPKYSWFRVTKDGVPLADVNGDIDFNPATSASDPFVEKKYQLTSTTGSFKVNLESSCKFGPVATGWPDAAFIDDIKLDVCIGMPEHVLGFALYPNPATDMLRMDFFSTVDRAELQVLNMQGQQMLLRKISGEHSVELDVSRFAPGIYTIRVMSEKDVKTVKFIRVD